MGIVNSGTNLKFMRRFPKNSWSTWKMCCLIAVPMRQIVCWNFSETVKSGKKKGRVEDLALAGGGRLKSDSNMR